MSNSVWMKSLVSHTQSNSLIMVAKNQNDSVQHDHLAKLFIWHMRYTSGLLHNIFTGEKLSFLPMVKLMVNSCLPEF